MQDSFSIGGFLGILFRRRRILIIGTLLAIIVSVSISLLLPRKYMSGASLLPVEGSSSSPLASILSQTGLPMAMNLFGDGGSATIDREILISATIRTRVVQALDLFVHYDLEEKLATAPASALDAAITRLGENTRIEVDDLSGVLRFSTSARDPELSREIADCYLRELALFKVASSQEQGRRKREFLESRLGEINGSLGRARGDIEEFSSRHGVVHLPSELEGELALVAELNRRLIFKQLERSVMSQDASPDSPLLGRLDTEIQVLENKLSELENGSPDNSYLHPLNSLPALTLEYFQLHKNLRIQQELQGLLIQQVEQAKLQESNDIPPLKILDSPRVPTLPVWPPKKIIVVLATMVGFALSAMLALLVEFLELVRVNDGGHFSSWEWIPGKKR